MKDIGWDSEKNDWLKQNRGVGFERVVVLFEQGLVIKILEHPNQEKYAHQKIAVVEMDGYAYLVPYVENEKEIFLKTIIPNRKATKKFLGGPDE